MQRELGDLIFIASIVFNGKKYFEKLTINQFKKDKANIRIVSWNMSNKGQLYLLSRFPAFEGVSGSIIPMKEYILPNYSGCLGSYGLIYKPGDFAFVSAIDLDSLVGVGNSVRINELHPLPTTVGYSLFPPYFYPDIDEFFYLMDRLSYNIFDFAHKYLTVGIGEPIFMARGIDNPQAKSFLRELLSAARKKAESEEIKDLSDFVDGFFEYDYVHNKGKKNPGKDKKPDLEEGEPRKDKKPDFRGGRIGIIHTIIDLGEQTQPRE